MDDVLLEQELFDLPAEEHVAAIMEGITDSLTDVAGTESLTRGQVYLSAVLVGNGMIKRNVAGVEGFFSKVGEGVKAGIEYLKKMAQAIWDFFFKRDAPKLANEAKAEVKKAEEAIKVAESGGSTPEETTKVLKDMRTTILALGHDPDVNKAALNQILKEADEALKKDQAAQKAAIKEIVKELPKLNAKARKKIKKKIEALVGDFGRMKEAVKKLVGAGTADGAHPVAKSVGDALKGAEASIDAAIKEVSAAEDMKDLPAVKKLVTEIKDEIAQTEEQHKHLEGLESVIYGAINKLHSTGDGAKDPETKKEIAALNLVLPAMTALVNASKQTLMNAKLLVAASTDLIGV